MLQATLLRNLTLLPDECVSVSTESFKPRSEAWPHQIQARRSSANRQTSRNTAVSGASSVRGASYGMEIPHCEKDVRKQTRHFRNLAPLCDNELLQRVHLVSLLNIIGD